jgi:hypothetical protein
VVAVVANGAENSVNIDETAVQEYMHDIDGDMGKFLADAATVIAGIVIAKAPVMKPWNMGYGRTSTTQALPPGSTKASVRPHGPAFDSAGNLFSGANANANASIFLEHPAVQMKHEYPFLTTGLWSLSGWL